MNILLTGATGFLGGRLIQQLVQGGHHVYVLARSLERAENTKKSIGEKYQRNVHILLGDVTEPFCGISQESISELKGKVDLFYHLAALVKFDLDLYDELYKINVEGTRHALQVAMEVGAQHFYHVSTAYTVGKGECGIEQLYPVEGTFNNPYEETKVAAENLVWSYKDKMNVAIFRPSIIVGDSKTGEANSTFTLYGLMRSLDVFKRRVSRRYKEEQTYALVGGSEGTSNIVPVDYVSDILAVAVGKAEPNTIYHITNPAPPMNRVGMELIKDVLDFHNLKIVEELDEATLSEENKNLLKLVHVLSPYFNRKIIFEDTNTQALIRETPIQHLQMDEKMLEIIIRGYLL